MSALLVIGTVLGSTIYPARKAAKIAAPAMAEEAFLSKPEGDAWSLPLPFSVSASEAGPLVAFLADWLKAYEEYTIGAFVTNGTHLLSTIDSPESPTHPPTIPNTERRTPNTLFAVTSTAWLAPYDLGVSQELRIDARPSPVPDVYMLTLTLQRLAGGSPSTAAS